MTKNAAPTKAKINEALIIAVEEASRARGERMTDVRREAVLALAQLKQPQSAYKILDIINIKRCKKLSAMSLYRALDYLVALGFAVKIDSTNSYALCSNGGDCHDHVMIVCDKCGSLDEVHDSKAFTILKKLADACGHALRNHAVEIHGLCEKCH
jgi:Fur family transcriptional regulator, zinc uptake regulator